MADPPSFPFPGAAGVALAPDHDALYRQHPFVPVRLGNGHPALLVTGHADVKAVLADPRFSRAAWTKGTLFARDEKSLALAMSDPPIHTRRRRAVQAAFTTRTAEMARPRIRALAERLLDEMEPLGSPADLVASFTSPLPYTIICEMLGVPLGELQVVKPLVDVMMSAGHFDADRVAEASRQMRSYFEDLIRRKRTSAEAGTPADDLITRLLTETEEATLTEDELVVLSYGMLMAGGDTTANHLAMGIYHLLGDPDLARRLREDEGLLTSTIEELIRWVWFAGTGGHPHVALEDVTVGGVQIAAGQVVIPLTDAANRDPAVFPDAHSFCPERTPNPHLGFGHGRHFCLGAAHARVELHEAISALLRRYRHLELAVPSDAVAWRSKMFIRGLWELPVSWRR